MKSMTSAYLSACISGLCATMLTVASVTVQAQIMKCVGKDGKIEFASSCPAGTKQQDTGVANKPAPAPTAKSDGKSDGKDKAAPKTTADRDLEFRKRQADQKDTETKAAQKATETADRQRACQTAQANLQALRNRQRMIRTDPRTGERVVYEDADYQRELPITERLVMENCKT